jgi:predicted nucleic acid-binding protein
MTSVLVDTDVISYLFKNDTRAESYRSILMGKLLVVSFMTVAELERWAIQKNWGASRRAKMEEHLRNFVVHPFSRDLCVKWAEATCSADRNGKSYARMNRARRKPTGGSRGNSANWG